MKHNFPLNPLDGNYVFDVVDQAISIYHQDLTFYWQDIMPFHLCFIYFVFSFWHIFYISVVLSRFPADNPNFLTLWISLLAQRNHWFFGHIQHFGYLYFYMDITQKLWMEHHIFRKISTNLSTIICIKGFFSNYIYCTWKYYLMQRSKEKWKKGKILHQDMWFANMPLT
jgi:hypothetical protein